MFSMLSTCPTMNLTIATDSWTAWQQTELLFFLRDIKWPSKQYYAPFFEWQYHSWLSNQDLQQLGHQSLISLWNERAQSAMVPLKKNINNLHVVLRNRSESITHATAKALSIQVTNTFKQCEDCTLGKAKQRPISKNTVPCSKILRERLFFNINLFLLPLLAVAALTLHHDSSNFFCSFFLKEKSNLGDIMLDLIENLKNKYNLWVKMLLQKNLQTGMAGSWLWIYSPTQQNGWVEQKFATLFNQLCAMLHGRKFNTYFQNGQRAKAANTARLLENNLITSNRNLSPFQQCLGREREAFCHSLIQKFGEMFITTYRNNTHQAK